MGQDQLPAQHPETRTSLVGRDMEAAAVAGLITSHGVQLVTLTGPGGIGKTRLAMRVMDEVRDRFGGGVTFISFGTLRNPALVVPTLLQAFQVRAGGGVDAFPRIQIALGEQRHLLVLDSFEHLIDEAPSIAALVSSCPSITALVTSRAALRLSIEREYPVGPLPVPADTERVSLADARASSAIALFEQRARAVKPDFRVTEENVATVAEIVARLDGLPLAIELAAVRSKVLAPKALLARLSHRLSLLTGGARDQPERLRTMRDAIAWSYDLLDPAEQVLFRRLAVFDGDFSLDGVEQVLGSGDWGDAHSSGPAVAGEGMTAPAPIAYDLSPLDGVASLVDKSLLVHEPGPTDSRYRMLGTVREFAAAELESSGEYELVRERHARWVLQLVEEARPHLYGDRDQLAWLQRLHAERPSIRGALNWALETGHDEIAVRMAGALWGYWFSTNSAVEGWSWLERAMEHVAGLPSEMEVLVACGAGFHALVRLDFERARALLERAERLARAAGDDTYVGWSTFGLGVLAQDSGHPGEAQTLFEAARDAFSKVPDRPALAATATQNLGLVISRQGDHARGAEVIEQALRTHRSIGFQLGIAVSSRFLGQVMYAKGDDRRAVDLLIASLQVERDVTQQWHIANALEFLTWIAARQKQPKIAAQLLGALEHFRARVSAPLEPAMRDEHDRAVQMINNALGGEFETAVSSGRSLSIGDAIALAATVHAGGEPVVATEPASAAPYGLTPRELDVLRQLVEGKSTADIAEELYISPRTVSTHVASILAKLEVPTRSAAVAMALRGGIV